MRKLTDTLQVTAPYRTGDPTATPPYAFMPGNEDMSAPVGAVLPGIKNKHTLAHISDIPMIQQATLQKNIDKQLFKKGKGKGKSKDKGKQEPEDTPTTQTIFRYIGTDTECTPCMSPFEKGQMVARVVCNHLFHEQCYHDMLNHDRGVDVDCPNRRGPPTTKAISKYLGNSDGDGA